MPSRRLEPRERSSVAYIKAFRHTISDGLIILCRAYYGRSMTHSKMYLNYHRSFMYVASIIEPVFLTVSALENDNLRRPNSDRRRRPAD